jgi:DNA-3-methyladenine glycosylase II
LTDAEVLAEISSVKGLGPWSAQNFLIFGLVRPDVLPMGDLGVRLALLRGYFPMNNRDFMASKAFDSRVKLLADRWAPYRTVATWFLWRSLENTP